MNSMGCTIKGFTVILLVGALLLAPGRSSPCSFAQDRESTRHEPPAPPPWEILARSLSFDSEKGIYQAEGDVVLSREKQVLSSQTASYNERTGIAEVPGPFRLEFNGDVLAGHDGTFDLENETGRLQRGELFLREDNMYLRGAEIKKLGENRFFMTDARLTACDGEKPAWSISGSEVDVTLEGYGTIKHAAFRIRDVPVLYTPYFIFPAKTKRQTGLLPPTIGYSGRKGMDLEVPFFWAISDSTDATFYQRYFTRRGYMQGMEYRYVASEESGGAFLLDILSDRKDAKKLMDPDELDLSPYERTNTTRYWARGRVDQELPLGVESRLDIDFVSDQDYLLEFESGGLGLQARPDLGRQWGRPLEEVRSPTRRSAMRLSRDGELHSLQAGMEYYQRPENIPNDTTPQPLAGALLDLIPRRVLGSPLYAGLRSDLDYIWRERGTTGYRTSASPSLSMPFSVGRYLRVEPFSEYTVAHQWYDFQAGGKDSRTRQAHESGLQLSSALERRFEPDFGSATSLNHRLMPVLTYRYRGQGDVSTPAPWFEPIDREGRVHQVGLSIRNYMDARYDRDERTFYRQWGYLILDQNFAIDRARKEVPPGEKRKPFDPLGATLGVNPGPGLTGRISADWDHYDRTITTARASMNVAMKRDRDRRDFYSLDYSSSRRRDTKYLGVSNDIYVTDGVSVGGTIQRELNSKDNIAQYAWMAFERQCWGMKFAVERSGHSTGFSVMFSLKGLGQFGEM